MDSYQKALKWAGEYLANEHGLSIVKTHDIELKSYSVVCKIETNQAVFYLKKTPQELFLEPVTIKFLNTAGCKNLPMVLAVNDELNCFLMSSVGNITLRQLYNGKAELASLKQGIRNFTSIQRSLETSIPAMLELGLPDWRLDKFTNLYHQLIEQEKLLLDDGLTQQEIRKLHKHEGVCKELCDQLLIFNIPETINHSDFHENNIVLDQSTDEVSLIDWGEAIVTHPFLSLCGYLWNINYFQDINIGDTRYHELQTTCIGAWRDLHDEETLFQALTVADKLNGIFAAFGYQRLYRATHDLENNVQQMHPGSIAGCLRSFLNAAV